MLQRDYFSEAEKKAAAANPHYDEWLAHYERAKGGAFTDALAFLQQRPECVNNYKEGGKWTLLHQACYWNVDRSVLQQFQALKADPLVGSPSWWWW